MQAWRLISPDQMLEREYRSQEILLTRGYGLN